MIHLFFVRTYVAFKCRFELDIVYRLFNFVIRFRLNKPVLPDPYTRYKSRSKLHIIINCRYFYKKIYVCPPFTQEPKVLQISNFEYSIIHVGEGFRHIFISILSIKYRKKVNKTQKC